MFNKQQLLILIIAAGMSTVAFVNSASQSLYTAPAGISPLLKYSLHVAVPALITGAATHILKIKHPHKNALLHTTAATAFAGSCIAAQFNSHNKMLSTGLLLAGAALGTQAALQWHQPQVPTAEDDQTSSDEQRYGTLLLAASAAGALIATSIINYPDRTKQIVGAGVPALLAYFLANQDTYCNAQELDDSDSQRWYGIQPNNLLSLASTAATVGAVLYAVAYRQYPANPLLLHSHAGVYCTAAALGMGLGWLINGILLKQTQSKNFKVRSQEYYEASFFPPILLACGPGLLLTGTLIAALQYYSLITPS